MSAVVRRPPKRAKRWTDPESVEYALRPATPSPPANEVATIQKADSLAPIAIGEYPNYSAIIKHRAEGRGVQFYDTMLATDADLAGFFASLIDDVLRYKYIIRAASKSREHQEHRRFLEFAFKEIPHFQNVLRHMLDSYARGFSVMEKMYRVVDRGEWRGAVVYEDLLDKPQRWFTFDLDRRLRFKTIQNQFPGELVDQEKFVVVTFGTNSSPWGRATLDECYWAWFCKHHLLEMEALWFEKWASPTPVAHYERGPGGTGTQERINEALGVAMSFMRDQAVAVPKGLELKLLESVRSGAISFENAIGQFTEMQSRRVTGQVLASMIGDTGSYAQARVHAKQESNKVEMIAAFASSQVARQLGRDLIDRNFGLQDAYPVFEIPAVSALERQAEATVEQMQTANGHSVSKRWSARRSQIVEAEDPDDVLTPSAVVKPGQALPVNTQLANLKSLYPDHPELWVHLEAPAQQEIAEAAVSKVMLANALAEKVDQESKKVHLALDREVHAEARTLAEETRRKLDKIAYDAASEARPAIRKMVAGFASKIRDRKSVKGLTRAALIKRMTSGMNSMGRVYERMLQRSDAPMLAEGDPQISDSAKIGLTLLALQILDRILQAAQDAPETMAPGEFADAILSPDAVAVDQTFGNLFEGAHSTDIASIHTANLRTRLASASFRKQFPYVTIVTQPDARFPHRMMDGYTMTAEDARYSSLLPPYDFGCRCVAVPIPDATAVRRGLTGANPTGTVEQYLRDQGVSPSMMPTASGFAPAYSNTDARAQLASLRQKVEEIRRTDPTDWAAIRVWLEDTFGYDPLTTDPMELA